MNQIFNNTNIIDIIPDFTGLNNKLFVENPDKLTIQKQNINMNTRQIIQFALDIISIKII